MLHLAISFDSRYITPLYVLLTSIFENNKYKAFHIHAVALNVSDSDKAQIKRYVRRNHSRIDYYNITENDLNDLHLGKDTHVTIVSYCRIFLPALLPAGVQRVLYLDIDMLVIDSLERLFNEDLHGYTLGAVPEVTATVNRPDLGIYTRGTYFNSGVLLIDVPQWKEQNISEVALQFAKSKAPQLLFADQDVMNVVFHGKYQPLDARYNVIHSDVPKSLPRAKRKQFLKSKVIIHFTLWKHKPWNVFCLSPLRYLYFKYLKLSPRSNQKKYTNLSFTPKAISKLVKIRTMELILHNTTTNKLLSPYFVRHKRNRIT